MSWTNILDNSNVSDSSSNDKLKLENSFINIDIKNILDMDDFVKSLVIVNKYEEFSSFKNQINNYISEKFSKYLEGKTDDYILAFNQSNVTKLLSSDEVIKDELKYLITRKNELYIDILLKAVILWKLDSILTQNEKNDVKILLKSWVFTYFDDVYLNWTKSTYSEKKIRADYQTSDWKLIYWGLDDWKVVWYNHFTNKKLFDSSNFNQIHDENLKKYMMLFSTFIEWWITNYNLWVEAEHFELNSWKNKDSIFWLVTPIEDYNFSWVLVEPELILFLKNNNTNITNEDFINLSTKYFNNSYWMDNMTLNFVETLIEWGESTFSGFIWKAFPNDNELAKRDGNSIILKNTDMVNIVENSREWFEKFFWEGYKFDFDWLYSELLKEVTYHEYWHSIFVKWHPSSNLEEAKATLFYYLKVYDENNIEKYSREDILRVVEFTLMDSIRNLERINQEKSFKYVVLTKINLLYLFASELVKFNDDWKMIIDADSKKFDTFIWNMKDMLSNIENIYSKYSFEWLDSDSINKVKIDLADFEKKYLNELDQQIMPIVNKMISLLKKED